VLFRSVADYFDKAYELEQALEKSGKTEMLALIRDVLPKHVRAVFVTQSEPLGLGHAVLCARPVIGDEPFAVLLPDDLIWNRHGKGALRQMTELAAENDAGVIAVQDVPRDKTGSYGIVARSEAHTYELQSLMRLSDAVFCLKKKNTKNTALNNKTHSITITIPPKLPDYNHAYEIVIHRAPHLISQTYSASCRLSSLLLHTLSNS